MKELHLGTNELRFAELIWKMEPLFSSELARLAEAELGWKKTTSFTVLKRLCDKGIFQNSKGTVTSLLSREEYDAARTEHFINETFDGSLPAFLAAFTRNRKLTKGQAAQLKKLVAEFEEDK